jgi:hypothetical protein
MFVGNSPTHQHIKESVHGVVHRGVTMSNVSAGYLSAMFELRGIHQYYGETTPWSDTRYDALASAVAC